MTQGSGGVVEFVAPGGLGAKAGLAPGDRLIAINDHPLRDIIDVQFYGAEEWLALLVERNGERFVIEVERDYDEELGLSFAHPTFDVDIRRCANNCDFCFVKQNAPGMRRSLYIKDDDYRYSFLFGNFVTLTNLTDDDWARLAEQRLSPLYVSVHTTDLALRRRFLGRRNAPDVLDQLHRLAALGIVVHTQVVLVPGLNDGPRLDRTLTDLTALYGQPVASVGIAPLGLTRYHPGPFRPYTPDESRAVLDQVAAWRIENRARWGCSLVYPSDEWYLVAGREIPPAVEYDGFPQAENGVGLVRQLLDEWAGLARRLQSRRLDRSKFRAPSGPQSASEPLDCGPAGAILDLQRLDLSRATLVCGTLIAPVLARVVAEWTALTGAEVRLVPVVNRFFGEVTTVSGLLTGQDVAAALQGRDLGGRVILPRAMFTGRYGAGSASPGATLDDMRLTDIAARLGVPVAVAGTMEEALAALTSDELSVRPTDSPRGRDARRPGRGTARPG